MKVSEIKSWRSKTKSPRCHRLNQPKYPQYSTNSSESELTEPLLIARRRKAENSRPNKILRRKRECDLIRIRFRCWLTIKKVSLWPVPRCPEILTHLTQIATSKSTQRTSWSTPAKKLARTLPCYLAASHSTSKASSFRRHSSLGISPTRSRCTRKEVPWTQMNLLKTLISIY